MSICRKYFNINWCETLQLRKLDIMSLSENYNLCVLQLCLENV